MIDIEEVWIDRDDVFNTIVQGDLIHIDTIWMRTPLGDNGRFNGLTTLQGVVMSIDSYDTDTFSTYGKSIVLLHDKLGIIVVFDIEIIRARMLSCFRDTEQ